MALKIETPKKVEPEQTLDINKPGEQPAPPPAKDAKPPVNLDGLKNFIKDFTGEDRYAKAEDATPPKPDEKPTEEKPKKPAEKQVLPSKAKAPGAKPFKPKAVPPTPALTPEQIAAAAAEGTARAMEAGKAKEREEKPAKDEPKLSDKDKRKVEILARMHVLYPDKYGKDISDKYADSITKLEAYAKKWETENPGQSFDEESPEHEAFFKANDVNWEDDDYTEALADIRAERRMSEAEKKANDRLDALDRKEQLRAKESEIAADQNTAAVSFWRGLGEDFAEVLKADGSLNMEKANALKTADPEGFAIRVRSAQNLDIEVAEICKLFDGLVENDPEHNPVHRAINQFAAEKERELAAKPIQERMNAEGKLFLPFGQYYRLNKTEKQNHWTFSKQDLAFLRATELALVTQKQVEANEAGHLSWARARGYPVDEPADAKPASPSSGGESRMAAVANGSGKPADLNGKHSVQSIL